MDDLSNIDQYSPNSLAKYIGEYSPNSLAKYIGEYSPNSRANYISEYSLNSRAKYRTVLTKPMRQASNSTHQTHVLNIYGWPMIG